MPVLKICRICLDTNVRGYSFDLKNLREEYEDVTGVKLHQGDGFPHWVCFECAALLHKYHKFKEKCHKGQKILERLQNAQPISYKAISCINRFTEDLHSKISLVVTDSHTKTFIFKHQNSILRKKLEKRKLVTVKEVIYYDSEGSIKQEDVKSKEVLINKQEKDNETAIKTEHIPAETVEQDISMDLDNDVSMDVGNASSDDENIFLDIVKKAVNGENQLVFLDGVKDEPINDSNKAKPRKFTQRKKEYLSMEYWKKYRLTEEEANATFSRKEHSDKYVKANYKCHNCFKGFSKLEMLMRHVKMKHDESLGPLECRFCHMRFKRKCMLTKHMVQHYAVYHCLRCDMRFYLETSAIFHEDYHNGVIRKCKHCGEEFKHSSTFYTHVRMAHRSGHICSMCGVSFVSEAGLAQHCRIKHFDKHTETSSETAEKNIYCEKCDLKFVSQSAFNLHLSHSDMHADGIEDVEVKRRNYKGKSADGIRKEKKSKKPTTCIHCGKYFNTQVACMKHHVAEHPRKTFYPADQRHICEVCGASLAAVSIASHMNRHTREHVYPCDICGMQFISKSSHIRHQITHTGERPYPCPLCDKRFTQKNSMQLHYNTFHLKQPYPKRNRKRKSDEMPLVESFRERDESDAVPVARWRNPLDRQRTA